MFILIFILILGLLVILHEFGHFIVAKRSKIKVEEFGIGLPPRIWGKKIGETIYSVNWLPIGGFVRLKGEDPTDKGANEKDSFYVKPVGTRILVVTAGVIANFLIGVILFYLIAFAVGFKFDLPLLVDHKFRFTQQVNTPVIVGVEENSPAKSAGLKEGQIITSVNNNQIESIDELQKIVRENAQKEVNIVVRDSAGNKQEIKVTPRKVSEDQGPLGVALSEVATIEYKTLPQKALVGFSHSINTVEYSGKIFYNLVKVAIAQRTAEPISSGVAGPVGIAQLTNQVVQLGTIATLQFAALLSLNLAVMNLLPIPALDGGRFAFLVVEAITRKRIYPKIEKIVHTAGFFILITLILVVTANDINRFLAGKALFEKFSDLIK